MIHHYDMDAMESYLSASDKDDGLSSDICHGQRGADLQQQSTMIISGFQKIDPHRSMYRDNMYYRIMRTLSSTVSHFVTSMPSIPRSCPPDAAEKSRSARSNFVSWSTASFPTNASPTKMILSGLFVATSCGVGGRRRPCQRCSIVTSASI